MNQLLVNKCLFLVALIAGACQLYSCKDSEYYDISGDTMNRVYFPIGNFTVNTYNRYVFSVKHTPAGSIGENISVATPVQCTQPAAADLKVSFSVNNLLVDTYNAGNGTAYKSLPDGIVDFNTMELTIPRGGLFSADSLKFSVPAGRYSQLTDSAYLMPLEVSSVSGAANTAVSSNRGVLYLIVKTSQTNSYDNAVQGDMVGSVISNRSAWTASLNATPASGTLSTMFDGRTNTYWSLTPSQKASFTVDLNNTYSGITGIRIHTSSTTYALTSVTVSTSTDGSNGTPQGTAALSTTAAYQYIKFYSPVSARYITLDIQGWRSSSSIRMAEFDVYTAD